jgi:glycosyltransferase involved in cell wall biosynthesis
MQIDILLSTFNSEKYLPDLISSIFNQTYKKWRIIVRDDGSIDGTLQLLIDLVSKYPNKIIFIENGERNVGPKRSFEALLGYTNSEYIMFCDHDDIWLPFKIEITLKRMKDAESFFPDVPILVCTDLTIVDSNLDELSNSFWKFSRINPANVRNIYSLSINNPVVGCTVMINRLTKIVSLPIPKKAIMHDWWIALKVASAGIIEYIPQSTILYRQHTFNTIGATKINLNYFIDRLKNIKKAIQQNIDAYQMLKQSNNSVNIFKFVLIKIKITFIKLVVTK